jgi:hypothetical protein
MVVAGTPQAVPPVVPWWKGSLLALNNFLANPFVYCVWHAVLGAAALYAVQVSNNHAAFNLQDLIHASEGAAIGAAMGWARNSTNLTVQDVVKALDAGKNSNGGAK